MPDLLIIVALTLLLAALLAVVWWACRGSTREQPPGPEAQAVIDRIDESEGE